MKKLFVLLLFICVFAYSGCTETDDKSDDTAGTVTDNVITDGAAADTISDPDSIDADTAGLFLNGERTVDVFSDKESIPLSDIASSGAMSKYALVDIDQDGATELVVEVTPSGDRIIVDVYNGVSTAYYLWLRSCNVIKKDGTSSWSSSAFENGTHKLSFSDGQVVFEDVIFRNSVEGIFLVNGKEVTVDEFNEAVRLQDEKESVEWINIE